VSVIRLAARNEVGSCGYVENVTDEATSLAARKAKKPVASVSAWR
jgi:hypothetical protein